MKTCSHLTGLALLAIGCTESTQPTQPEQRNAIQLAAASSTSQNVVVDKFVPDVPTVIAYDGKGVPVAGAVVTFSMAAGGGGTIEHSVDTTNSAGVAQIRLWRVGTKTRDRKSTRLNSSHSSISYAVFCLKKKNT